MSDIAPILVLQHIGCEPPAAYEDELARRGLPLRRVLLHEGETLPDWRRFAAIIAMGGPMGAYDDELHPWLAAEKELIARAVESGVPFWGVCLGAQLLAASLGARVMPGEGPEVGVAPVSLTIEGAEDPVFSVAPATFDALHWHGDTYELPRGASRLAASERYDQQAFSYGGAYGLQFHLEVPASLAAGWLEVPAYAQALEQAHGEHAGPALLTALRAAEPAATELARELFGRWLELVVGLGTSRAQTARA